MDYKRQRKPGAGHEPERRPVHVARRDENGRLSASSLGYVKRAIADGSWQWPPGDHFRNSTYAIVDRDDPMCSARRFAICLARYGTLIQQGETGQWYERQPEVTKEYSPLPLATLTRWLWLFLEQCKVERKGAVVPFKPRERDVREIMRALPAAVMERVAHVGYYHTDDE